MKLPARAADEDDVVNELTEDLGRQLEQRLAHSSPPRIVFASISAATDRTRTSPARRLSTIASSSPSCGSFSAAATADL
jgi:hypothetical protein